MYISLIWAMTRNRVIGKDNALPWNLPDEMKFFMETTWGKPVIMGRRTYETLPSLLPNRANIVVTTQNLDIPRGAVVHSLNEGLSVAEKICEKQGLDECFVIGGAGIYAEVLESGRADRLYVTTIDAELSGDTYFPLYDTQPWALVREIDHPQDDQHQYAYKIQIFDRNVGDY